MTVLAELRHTVARSTAPTDTYRERRHVCLEAQKVKVKDPVALGAHDNVRADTVEGFVPHLSGDGQPVERVLTGQQGIV